MSVDATQQDGMEVDEISNDTNNNNNDTIKVSQTPNTISTISLSSNSNSNSMEIDTDIATTDENKENQRQSLNNMTTNISTNNVTKRRKKRTRDEMEIDAIDLTKKDGSDIITKTSGIIKKRKISTASSMIQPMPQKWKDKYREYTNIITQNYQLLLEQDNTNKALFESQDTQNELKLCQEKLLSFIDNIKDFPFDEYVGLISKLAYGRHEGLTDLTIYIRDILTQNQPNLALKLSHLDVREVVLKSSERKLYGIKPTKSINKTEEKIVFDVDHSNLHWNKCRLYLWECLSMDDIPNQYQMDLKEMRNLSTLLSKYGSFCKKYDVLLNKRGVKTEEKDQQLQKMDDNIVSWISKQQQLEKQKEIKAAALRKKKEAREQQMRERKEKKEEQEKLKKEKAEQRQKQKEEKLKREQERKEKIEKERLERKRKKEQELKEKEQQKKEREQQKKEKEQQKKEREQQKLMKKMAKTPQSEKCEKKKHRKSMLDKWVKVTKYEDTSNKNATPIITDKTLSLSNNNSISESLSISPDKIANKSLYEIIFKPPNYAPNTIIAPIHYHRHQQTEYIQCDTSNKKVSISDNIPHPKPTAIPSVLIEIHPKPLTNQNNSNQMNDGQHPIDLTLEDSLCRMQIDNDTESKQSEDIQMNDAQNKTVKIQWKYRFFEEDNRPQFFGVNIRHNPKDLDINIKKLCRNPLLKMDINREIVDYEADDSGVEYYDDMEDGEDLEGFDDLQDEDEMALDEEERMQKQMGLMRQDGFENDEFIINSEDDDDEALGDKDIMENLRKYKRLQAQLKDEYPVRFANDRERGDDFDKPITIRLPMLKNMESEYQALYALTIKKAMVVMEDEVDIESVDDAEQKQNDIEYLLEIENKNNDTVKDKDKDKEEKEKKKKKKKKKSKRKKKEKEKGKETVNDKMECDGDEGTEEEDEDDDIKMKDDGKKKLRKQSTLTHYFKASSKEKSEERKEDVNMDENVNKNQMDVTKGKENEMEVKEPKKKKRRVVVCELIE